MIEIGGEIAYGPRMTFLRALTLFFVIVIAPSALAASGSVLPVTSVIATITGPQDIAVGRTLVLDASDSAGLGEGTTYRWYRDASPTPISRSVEAVYTPDRPGITEFTLVIRTTINGEELEITAKKRVQAYLRKIVLITDSSTDQSRLTLHAKSAAEVDVYLRIVQATGATLPLVTEQALMATISENMNALAGAEAILLLTDGFTGLQALTHAIEGNTDRLSALKTQSIILIADGSLTRLARSVRGHYAILQPQQILITRREGIYTLLTAPNIGEARTLLAERDIDAVSVDADSAGLRPWNLFSSLVNYMVTHGVPTQTVILLLMLPIIATIIAFLKQVIGITTFGLFTPSIVALSFLTIGWPIGLLFLVSILITGYATRRIMARWRLLHIPKVAIIITAVSLSLIGTLAIFASFGITFASDTIFVLLIMSTLAESFLAEKKENSWWGSLLGIAETIFSALLCMFIVQWGPLQSFVFAYPELLLLTVVVNVGLARWTGLRLVEYVRFRAIFHNMLEE